MNKSDYNGVELIEEDNTYTNSAKQRYAVLGLGLLFIAIAVWTGTKWHEADFDYLFGTMKYWQGFSLLGAIFTFAFFFMGGENRNARIYLNANGELDLSTPRHYEKLRKPLMARFLGRANSFRGLTIESFDYEDGVVTIENSKGKVVSGRLEDLTFKYNVEKGRIYFYQVTDSEGNKVKFYLNNAILEDEEWDDITLILDQCGTVNEGKLSRIANKVTKAVEIVQNFDVSEVTGSVVGSVSESKSLFVKSDSKIAKKLWNKYADRIKNPDEGNKLSKWERILLCLLGLYVLVVLIVNIINFPAWSSDADDEMDDFLTEQTFESGDEEADGTYTTEESEESATAQPSAFTFSGYFEDGKGQRWPVKISGITDGEGFWDDCVYINEKYGTKIRVDGSGSAESITFISTQKGEPLTIRVNYEDNRTWGGTAVSGNTTLRCVLII